MSTTHHGSDAASGPAPAAPAIPRVSILLPVFNAAPFVAKTVESMLQQTYRDFELIAIDDGSTDDSVAVLETFSDPRIRLFRNAKNLGLIGTLNHGMTLCRGEFVARMDADDLCHPRRLEKQVAFLDANPGYVMVGSQRASIDELGRPTDDYNNAVSGSAFIRWKLLTGNFITHPAVVLRRAAVPVPLFAPEYPHAEDYAAWLTLLAHGEIETLPERLVIVRFHSTSVSARNRAAQVMSAMSALRDHIRQQYQETFTWQTLALWSAPEDARDFQASAEFFRVLRFMNPLGRRFRGFLKGKAAVIAWAHYHRRLAFLLFIHHQRPELVVAILLAIALSGVPS